MSNLSIGIVIGAALSGTFGAAVTGARSGIEKIGKGIEELTKRHKRMGDIMAQGLSHAARPLGALNQQYLKLGSSIQAATKHQQQLATAMSKMQGLKAGRDSLRMELIDKAALTTATVRPFMGAVQTAGNFQDQLRDISITGEFSKAEEAQLGRTIRENSLRFNQTQEALSQGISVLVAGGISSSKELAAFAPILAKAATATRANVDELGSVFLALRDNLKISAKDSESALNMLAYAGKKGQFEIRDMAKWLPNLAPQMAALGLTGKEAVAEIGAALQIARKGAGTNDEAANNFRNFLAKVTAPDTIKDFQKAGIDLKGDLIKLREQGMTPMQGMLQLITQYMGTKGPEAANQFTKALAIKDDAEREAAITRLKEAYKLGELFQDMQAMNFIKPAIANAKEMAAIKSGAMAAGGDDLLGKDLAKRTEGFNEQLKRLKISVSELGISLGSALLPGLNSIMAFIGPVVRGVSWFTNQFPKLTAAVSGAVIGIVVMSTGLVAFRFGMNMVMATVLSAQVSFHSLAAGYNLVRASMVAGTLQQTLAATSLGRMVLGIRSAALATKAFSLSFITSLRAASIALLTTPIGWTLLAIGAAAGAAVFLIYKYWKPISGFFKGLWSGLKEGLKGLAPAWDVFKKVAPILMPILVPLKWIWNAVKALLKPVDDTGKAAKNMGVRFGKALSGILTFVLTLPTKMLSAGFNIVNSLFEGMKKAINKPVELMKGLVQKLRNMLPFSPAKEGPLKDIHKIRLIETIAGTMKPAPMVQAMRAVTAATMLATASPAMAGAPVGAGRAGGGSTITFAPVINLAPGTPAEARQQVEQALKFSQAEFERMLARADQNKQRKGFV
jgi:TP901 family phage tail tape measure protein